MGVLEDLGNFVNSITSGQGQNYNTSRDTRQGSQPGGPDVKAPSGMTRPKMRPGTLASQYATGESDGEVARQKAAANFANITARQQAAPRVVAPKASELIFDNVPYYSGPNIRPPTPAKNRGFKNFKETYKNLPSSMATDLRLGIGSLSGPEGFTDALESLGFGTLRNEDGGISDEAALAYANFQQASRDSQKRQETESMGDGDDNNFYGNYDPCPGGYRTDPVTGMCVPVMGVAYETAPAPAAPAQYQGNFVASPFPDLAPRGPALPMGRMPAAGYTQPIDYVRPTISPPTPQGIAGIPMTPIIG